MTRASRCSDYDEPELRALSTRLGDLDIVQRLPGVPSWRSLSSDVDETTLAGIPLAVSSREHLIEMKRARNSLQDQADIHALEAGDPWLGAALLD